MSDGGNIGRILRIPQVIAKVGLGRSTIYGLMKDGNFPQSIKLGAKAVGWSENDLNAWLGKCKAVSQSMEAAAKQ